jgi:2-polyprenyl-3-methyl-5-hydroxy-6-metoxy-1,4-benzoquinol methylase
MNPYIPLPKVEVLKGRQDIVVATCKGKSVLHLGCVDAGMLEERFARGKLLHQKLAAVAAGLYGVDIDAEGIRFLREHGFDNVLVGDVCRLGDIQELEGCHFDVVVACEVVEHLLNPGLFFDSVKAFMDPGTSVLIVSVPNAFRIDTILQLLKGVEFTHPDHNYWFSYATTTNLLQKNGFVIDKTFVYSFQSALAWPSRLARWFGRNPTPPSGPLLGRTWKYLRGLPRAALVSWLYRKTPFWGDGILVLARLPGK